MNAARWESVKLLLQQAMAVEGPEERERFLDEACASDISLRAEVDSLLAAADDVRTTFMQGAPLSDAFLSEASSSVALQPGDNFEQRFRLVRKLGEGGMGQVWLAEQSSPVRRQVALKLIRAGMYDESVVRR